MASMILNENYIDLTNAIILQAVRDFKAAYRRLKKFPDDKLAQNRIQEITSFFRSDYFRDLSDLDGSEILRLLIKKLDEPKPAKPKKKGGAAR